MISRSSVSLIYLLLTDDVLTELDDVAFTRTITAIYVLTLLTLQTHVQLNLLGRSTYITSVVTSHTGESSETIQVENGDSSIPTADGAMGVISKETERMYLTFSWWLLHQGWKDVAARVQMAVEEIVGPYVSFFF